MATEWAIAAGALFVCTTVLRTAAVGKPWRSWIPGGIAVAVGKLSCSVEMCHILIFTSTTRHVQRAIIYTRQGHWRHTDLGLAALNEAI